MTVQVTHPSVVLHGSGIALACGLDGDVRADELHGMFIGDTRVLSTYRMTIGDQPWELLGRNREGHGTATWTFQSPLIRTQHGELPPGALFLSLRRRLAGALHDDLTIYNYANATIHTRLVVQLDADFADIFEVKDRHLPPRLDIVRLGEGERLTLDYQRAGFRRALHVHFSQTSPSPGVPEFVGSQVIFDIALGQAGQWTCCVNAQAEIDGEIQPFDGDPHDPEPDPVSESAPTLRTEPILQLPFDRGCADFHALANPDGDTSFVSAGVPWFMCLFGRDTLVSALMTGLLGAWPARGALAALARLQADETDDWRDAEPGKLPHELRQGELAFRHAIPHTPYFGTHDAPALYCLTLWNAWRSTGDDTLLDDHIETAQRALNWCDDLGDRDGDGLQEYATRSKLGYYNQSWKDAADAIVDAAGHPAKLPIATIELQGYLYAARLAMAELCDHRGDASEATRLRTAASSLHDLVEERYWMEDEGFYAIALDGDKEPVRSISSNPGQLLWSGLPGADHAERTARRLLADDMFSGWGLRTLSSKHPFYNPLAYQRGSVWPHDTMLTAAGMFRYGLRDEGAMLIRGVLDAACNLEEARLPELFCGLGRDLGGPVPYAKANIPQAWAAATAPLAAQLFLGIVPDAPHGRCFVDPWLPEWLPRLEIDRLRIGGSSVRIAIARSGEQTVVEKFDGRGLDMIHGRPEAALWGAAG
ncbi:MAG: glycogen debranching N-terminal domain-containing protein [Ilumatobacteraceae bacterium]